MKKLPKNQCGFTLIELLVVMTIIGILSGIGVFSMENARKSGRDGQRKSDLESIRQSLEMYRADCGVYPPSTQVSFGNLFRGDTAANGCNPASTVYSTVLPSDPTGSVPYQYVPAVDRRSYTLCARLEGITGAVPPGCSGTRNYSVRNP